MSERMHTPGLVIRARRDKDVVLTLLTPEMGKITVIAKGARSLKGPQMALSQMFCYGDFELYRRGDLYWLHTGELKENFYGICTRLDALNLAAYFCEVAYAVTQPGEGAEELLRLLLNSLYFLANQTYDDRLVKGVFEWRVLHLQGVSPALERCAGCGCEQDEDFALDITAGQLLCGTCRARRQNGALPVEDAPRSSWTFIRPGALQAARFALNSPMDRMMAFRLEGEEDRRDFARVGESFLVYHLDVDSTALRMYEQMKGTDARMRTPISQNKETKIEQ